MTAIWSEGSEGWELLEPTGFPDEATLQELVATAPDLLPLSGARGVIVLGREVLLGSGYVDVLAIEPSGRPVVVEVKLRNNTESPARSCRAGACLRRRVARRERGGGRAPHPRAAARWPCPP